MKQDQRNGLVTALRRVVVGIACVLALVLCAGAAYTWYGAADAERSFPPRGKFVSTSLERLHYAETGQGDAIVLLHGASSNLREFDSNLFVRLASDFHVLSFDRPGYGYSERPADRWPSPQAQAQAIHEALETLGIHRAVLVGHSWSGSVVMAYALDYPQATRGIVTLGGGTHPWKGGVAWHVELASRSVLGKLFGATLVFPLGQLLSPAAVRHVFWPQQPPADYAQSTGMVLALRPQTWRASAEDVARLSPWLEDQSRRYPQLEVPVLALSGTHDHVVPAWNHATRVTRQYHGAELVLIENAGHALHHSHTAEVARHVRAFARRVH